MKGNTMSKFESFTRDLPVVTMPCISSCAAHVSERKVQGWVTTTSHMIGRYRGDTCSQNCTPIEALCCRLSRELDALKDQGADQHWAVLALLVKRIAHLFKKQGGDHE